MNSMRAQPIPGFDKYFCSSTGIIISHKQIQKRQLKPKTDKWGYLLVCLHTNPGKKYKFVHDLVATTFIGPRPTGLVINHKDGNKKNNNFKNLEYCTQTENERHSVNILGKWKKFKEKQLQDFTV